VPLIQSRGHHSGQFILSPVLDQLLRRHAAKLCKGSRLSTASDTGYKQCCLRRLQMPQPD
jgi:hypothetical protein